MLNDILSPMSRTLLSADEIAPIAGERPSPWAERTYRADLRETLPAAQPGDGASLEAHRRALNRALSACIADAVACAPHIHALLNAASWSDISGGDPYACDPCGMDEALADTACRLATVLNLMREELQAISPALTGRIEGELRRRVLTPLADHMPDNLSLIACCRLLCAAILGGTDESLRWPVIRKLCSAIDRHLDRLPADGSIPGGLTYAADTAVALMNAAEVIRAATRGRVNLTRHERLACMADPILFSHINDGWFINPGEHTMQPSLDAESLFRFGRRAGDGALCDTASWMLHNLGAHTAPDALTRALNHNTAPDLLEIQPRMRLFRDGMLSDTALMFMRGFNLHIAMTGGTGTSHADAGNICLMHRDQRVLIDLGGDACAADMHSVPVIAGMLQLPGVSPRATEFASGGEDTTCYSVNLTGAYPADCPLEDYQRTLLMGSPQQACIRLIEMIQLKREATVDFCFICAREPQLSDCAAAIGPATIRWDAGLVPETQPLDGAWRLVLHAPEALSHNYTFVFR